MKEILRKLQNNELVDVNIAVQTQCRCSEVNETLRFHPDDMIGIESEDEARAYIDNIIRSYIFNSGMVDYNISLLK